jgi:hypothetical protein
LRRLQTLWLAAALGGCAPNWVPWIGSDEPDAAVQASAAEPDEATGRLGGAEPQAAAGTGCSRKGRRWPEGSRVCEDHRVTRCFGDGEWHIIGSC